MSKTKELVICIVAIIALILSISTNVFATTTDFNALLQNMNTNQGYQTIPDNSGANLGIIDLNNTTQNNTPANNITPNSTPTTTNNNIANNNNTNTIPYTGVSNFSIIAIIAVCAVVAVYAYKKIRDYNA